MDWTPETIKTLRLRLGWSAADFGRHLGVKAQTVMTWESSSTSLAEFLDFELKQVLHRLWSHVETQSLRTTQMAHVEAFMSDGRWAQATHDFISEKQRS